MDRILNKYHITFGVTSLKILEEKYLRMQVEALELKGHGGGVPKALGEAIDLVYRWLCVHES